MKSALRETILLVPIRIHPHNPKIFEFRGQSRVLITASEHYGAVINRPFRFEAYLADAAEKGITLTRLFMLFREQQSPSNPYSTCKPESPDYIAPFRRIGHSLALDGQLQYDLDQWNPEYFERLHRFLDLASGYGIIVEVVLLSNTYADSVWALNPLNPHINTNGLETIHWAEYMTLRHPRLFERQAAHVRKIVEETCGYDNVIYEICNEPGGSLDSEDSPSLVEVNTWQAEIAHVIRSADPAGHLIAGQEAFAYWLADESLRSGPDVHQFADATFDTLDFFDIANMHPLSNMVSRGQHYNLGPFMAGKLHLEQLQKYCLDLYGESKPLNLDEDNAASQYKDTTGWTIHRKRAWTTLFCGGHYDVIDFSIINYCETGTPASQQGLRLWMKHLSGYIHSIDLVRATPAPQVVRVCPEPTLASALVVPGEDISIYLADARETGEPGAGEAIMGELVCDLPAGNYVASCFSPLTGLYSPGLPITSDGRARLVLPRFSHDLVVRFQKA